MVIKRVTVLASAALLAACSLDKQAAPALTGPSTIGLSLVVTATPDQLPEDGQSTATITVVARDGNSMPVAGLTLNGVVLTANPSDNNKLDPTSSNGTLASQTISTDSTGKATVVFTAPIMTSTSATPIEIQFTPVGTNTANDVPQSTNMILTPPNTISLPGPTANFTFSSGPNGTHFDGSSSVAVSGRTIVSWEWYFGDGSPHGFGVAVDHAYATQGPFVVTLRVTDSAGQVGLATKTIQF